MGAEKAIKIPLKVKRDGKRSRIMAPATLLTATQVIDVRLRDLSRDGALVETSAKIEQDSEVVFSCNGAAIPASVAWVIGKRYGLRFHHPIDQLLADLGFQHRP